MKMEKDHHETKNWRGFEVDYYLKEDWLVALNSIPGAKVCSTCSGHPGETYRRGGAVLPGFAIAIRGDDAERVGMKLKKALSDKYTASEVRSWGGPTGEWDLKINGEYVEGLTPKELQYKIQSVSITADSKIQYSPRLENFFDQWWERAIRITTKVMRERTESSKRCKK